MDNEAKELNEELELENPTSEMSNDELKAAIGEQMNKLRLQAMLLGAQSMCQTVLNKVTAFENAPGKKSNNDYKRLVKEIKQFCTTGLSRKVNADGTATPKDEEETVQN